MCVWWSLCNSKHSWQCTAPGHCGLHYINLHNVAHTQMIVCAHTKLSHVQPVSWPKHLVWQTSGVSSSYDHHSPSTWIWVIFPPWCISSCIPSTWFLQCWGQPTLLACWTRWRERLQHFVPPSAEAIQHTSALEFFNSEEYSCRGQSQHRCGKLLVQIPSNYWLLQWYAALFSFSGFGHGQNTTQTCSGTEEITENIYLVLEALFRKPRDKTSNATLGHPSVQFPSAMK